jgi:hypothetical protein
MYVLMTEVVVFVGVTLMVRSRLQYHLHHYALAMVGVSLIGYQNTRFTMLQAVLNGTMIEGAARWGYDPLWYVENKVYTLREDTVLILI